MRHLKAYALAIILHAPVVFFLGDKLPWPAIYLIGGIIGFSCYFLVGEKR